jgi:hypothetical protein
MHAPALRLMKLRKGSVFDQRILEHTVVQLYGCTVVRLYSSSCTAVRSFGFTVVSLYSCTTVRLYVSSTNPSTFDTYLTLLPMVFMADDNQEHW